MTDVPIFCERFVSGKYAFIQSPGQENVPEVTLCRQTLAKFVRKHYGVELDTVSALVLSIFTSSAPGRLCVYQSYVDEQSYIIEGTDYEMRRAWSIKLSPWLQIDRPLYIEMTFETKTAHTPDTRTAVPRNDSWGEECLTNHSS